MKQLLLSLLLLIPLSAVAFTPNDPAKTVLTDGTYLDTTNALQYVFNKNQDGWVMTVGSSGQAVTWTNKVNISITNYFIFQGADPNNRPVITFGSGPVAYGFGLSLNAGTYPHHTVVKDFIFTDASGGPSTSIFNVSGDGVCFRLTNVQFTNTYNANSVGTIGGFNTDTNLGPFGLIDHCEIVGTSGSIYGFFSRGNGNSGNGNGTYSHSWDYPMTFGTSNSVVIESNVFHTATAINGRPFADGASGARVTARWNTATNYTFVVHGPDSGGISNSTLQVECYYNTFVCPSGQTSDYFIYSRGGSARIFSNFIYNIGGSVNHITKMSVDCASSSWNAEGCPQQYLYPANYPVYQQVGQGVTGFQTVGYVPIYIWSNSLLAGSLNFSEPGIGSGGGDASFITAGLDYFFNSGPPTGYTPYGIHFLYGAVVFDPSITVQPQNQTVANGGTATFSVTATTGSPPLTYQWMKNGSNISSATQSSYSFNVTCADNGELFSVQVCNSTNSCVTSSSALLTVTGCQGTNAVYSSQIGKANIGSVRF